MIKVSLIYGNKGEMIMDAIEFFMGKSRMCNSFGSDSCDGCKFKMVKGNMYCDTYIKRYPERAVEIVEEWLEEHPKETYLTQFLKYYPNALMNDDGTPEVCVNDLGIKRNECIALNCIKCWNTPIEE